VRTIMCDTIKSEAPHRMIGNASLLVLSILLMAEVRNTDTTFAQFGKYLQQIIGRGDYYGSSCKLHSMHLFPAKCIQGTISIGADSPNFKSRC
jgi:hypothetical protein